MRSKLLALLVLPGLIGACAEQTEDPIFTPVAESSARFGGGPAVPAGLQTVSMGTLSLTLWPFTGNDFQTAVDPINLVFAKTDPRQLRAALMALAGDRSAFGFPNVAPFNCTWKDAVGAIQTGYSAGAGWTGSAIQLECGDYGPMRFHVRLFDGDGWTLGNSHFEVLIPGTTDHEVLSWELAQQLVTVDMVRSGLLDAAQPMVPTGVINPVPTYRTINPLVYNGLPAALIGLIGGPAKPVAAPVPIPSDGRATIFNVAKKVEVKPEFRKYEFTIPFGQVIPKPFCSSGPADYVRVDGPVVINQTVLIGPFGNYGMETHIQGDLKVTAVNPTTNPPTLIGATHDASVFDLYTGVITDHGSLTTMLQNRKLLPTTDPFGGTFKLNLRVGAGRLSDHRVEEVCGS